MYSEDNEYNKDLNLQMNSFFVAVFSEKEDSYVQHSIRMSLENAVKLCDECRNTYPKRDFKVHGELDF